MLRSALITDVGAPRPGAGRPPRGRPVMDASVRTWLLVVAMLLASLASAPA
jgi:hypothetical protein